MEILSFVLGISFVVVIVIAIVAIVGFFKVKKLERNLDDYCRGAEINLISLERHINSKIDQLIRDIDINNNEIYRKIEETEYNIHSTIDSVDKTILSVLDSQINKLENKFRVHGKEDCCSDSKCESNKNNLNN